MLIDPRVRVLLLLVLSVTHAVASVRMLPLLLFSTLVLSLIYRRHLARGARTIAITALALGIFVIIVWLFSSDTPFLNLFLDYLRWISLAVMSVTLFLSLNPLELITSLFYFRLPLGIAIAVGVGWRFLPVFFEEARRVRLYQRHRESLTFRQRIRVYGVVDTLSRVISPFMISVLRRVDLLLLSIAVQQLENRISAYRFSPYKVYDWLAFLAATSLLVASIII